MHSVPVPKSVWHGRVSIPPRTLLIGCVALDGAAFLIDALLSAEYSVGILYVGATLLAFWLPWKRAIVGLSLLSTLLLVLGYVISPVSPGYGTTETIINRVLEALIIWWATALALGHRASRMALESSEADSRAKEARIHSILDTAPEALITIDDGGCIQSFSRSSEALFGYRADEVIGKNIIALMPSPYREEHDGYLERYLRTGERRIIGLGRVVSARRRDGSVFPIELAVGEARVDGHRLFTGFIRDLTASQKIEQELRQAQKMEAVGQLTGGVAHDFNNLLTVIIGNLEMLEMRLADERQLELVREARETAEHGAQLTERLLAFGRRQPLQPKLTNIGDLVEGMSSLMRRTLGESIEVNTLARGGPNYAHVDSSQLQNAILNLAINARDAMLRGGKLTVAIESAQVDADYARIHPEVRAGRYVIVAVTDTGTGMPKEVQERAFEPFFTTKEVGAGSGLGLSMVYGFAKQSGGHVALYSEPGHGTTIRIYLPRARTEKDSRGDPADDLSLVAFRGQGQTVLVVEDETRVRRMTVTRLEDLGYEALDAANGPAAVDLLAAHPEVDLLFTDMIMPGGMTGADLAIAARAKRPEIKVLLTSGYAEPDVVKRGLASDARWLRKPYSSLELARTLREIFGWTARTGDRRQI